MTSPTDYRTELDRSSAAPVALAAQVIQQLPPNPTERQWQRFTAALLALNLQARARARSAAVGFYRSHGGTDQQIPPLLYDARAVRHLLDRVVKPRLAAETPTRQTVNATTMAVQRHVDMAARNTIMQLVDADPQPLGWARVLTGRENCAFCIVLASRGPVYHSQKTAGGMDRWHDGCDCIAVPVFNRNAWPGRDTYLYAHDIYTSTPGKPSVANVRRHLDSLAPESPTSSAA